MPKHTDTQENATNVLLVALLDASYIGTATLDVQTNSISVVLTTDSFLNHTYMEIPGF